MTMSKQINYQSLRKLRRQTVDMLHDFEKTYITPLQLIQNEPNDATKQTLKRLHQETFDVIGVDLANDEMIADLYHDYEIIYYFATIARRNKTLPPIAPFEELHRPDVDESVRTLLRHHQRITKQRAHIAKLHASLGHGRSLQKSTHARIHAWHESQTALSETIYAMTGQKPSEINQLLSDYSLEQVRTLNLRTTWLQFAPPVVTK